jgi:hypothetical protein
MSAATTTPNDAESGAALDRGTFPRRRAPIDCPVRIARLVNRLLASEQAQRRGRAEQAAEEGRWSLAMRRTE